MRLVQIAHSSGLRRVAIVDGERLRLLPEDSVYEFVKGGLVSEPGVSMDYEPIYRGESEWRLLPPIDHPEPSRCLVSGTGLTHLKGAANRDAMHQAATAVTDSARMYELGVAGGRPAVGMIGAAPEWFYKGTGSTLRAHNQPLDVPAWAEDGGDEPEIAGIYVIDERGVPRRIGMAQGNEFSDHVFERRNYLNLAGSKLRTCSLGPELVMGAEFRQVRGRASVERAGKALWSEAIATGEEAMCHSLANLEHHHFKFEAHRRPGDIHVHYFGASAFSFGAGITLEDGDIMEVAFDGFGRPLRNPVRVDRSTRRLIAVEPL